jgi:hypothetical protein
MFAVNRLSIRSVYPSYCLLVCLSYSHSILEGRRRDREKSIRIIRHGLMVSGVLPLELSTNYFFEIRLFVRIPLKFLILSEELMRV